MLGEYCQWNFVTLSHRSYILINFNVNIVGRLFTFFFLFQIVISCWFGKIQNIFDFLSVSVLLSWNRIVLHNKYCCWGWSNIYLHGFVLLNFNRNFRLCLFWRRWICFSSFLRFYLIIRNYFHVSWHCIEAFFKFKFIVLSFLIYFYFFGRIHFLFLFLF